MSKPESQKIRNWADLQEEKRRLNTYLDAKEGLLARRWGRIKSSGKDILYNKIFIPLSVMSLGAVLARLFTSGADTGSSSFRTSEKQEDREEKRASAKEGGREKGWFSSENIEVMAKAAKILLPVILAAFTREDDGEKSNEAEKQQADKKVANEEAIKEPKE